MKINMVRNLLSKAVKLTDGKFMNNIKCKSYEICRLKYVMKCSVSEAYQVYAEF